MDDQNDVAFSFGSVEDTYFQNVNQQIQIGKLPYNPFVFDLSLKIQKSPQGYQEIGKHIELNNSLINVFGRKGKCKKNQQQSDPHQIRHDLKAQTLSRRHFSINQNHQLDDQGSKKGTFIWIHRNSPKLIQSNDEFLLNNILLKINDINKTTQKIQIQLQTTIITLNPKNFKDRLFLIGSHKKCHFVKNGLKNFHVGFDMFNLTLHNLIEDQDCDVQNGTWIKIKQPVKIEGGNMFMTGPYVFQVKW